MAARGRGGRTRGRHAHAVAHENEERWLLTYADMITLLMALFMVLFSISSVNVSKYQTLQQSLKSAFSGSILTGGKSIIQSGSQSTRAHSPATSPVPAIIPATPNVPKPMDTQASASASASAQAMTTTQGSVREQTSFEALKRRLDAYARRHGFAARVQTLITRQGLVVRVLTDNLLFGSGSAQLESSGDPLLDEVADLLKVDTTNPITVEGNTDDIPIHTPEYTSNWQLSTARAVTVLQYFTGHGVAAARLGAAGYADEHPVASNATAVGRARNRRVDIVLDRLYPAPQVTTNP